MFRSIATLCQLSLLATLVGCTPSTVNAPIEAGETAGQLGDEAEGEYGCSNALIRQQQESCRVECPSLGQKSAGVKYCKTDDPTGQAGNVDAPCACFVPTCGALGEACCPGSVCGSENVACDESNVCVALPPPPEAPAAPVIDPARDYIVTITSVKLSAMTSNSPAEATSWDPFFGTPDPKVCVGKVCSVPCEDTFVCHPSFATPVRVSGEMLLAGIPVIAYDDDFADADDEAAAWYAASSLSGETELEAPLALVTYRVDAVE